MTAIVIILAILTAVPVFFVGTSWLFGWLDESGIGHRIEMFIANFRDTLEDFRKKS